MGGKVGPGDSNLSWEKEPKNLKNEQVNRSEKEKVPVQSGSSSRMSDEVAAVWKGLDGLVKLKSSFNQGESTLRSGSIKEIPSLVGLMKQVKEVSESIEQLTEKDSVDLESIAALKFFIGELEQINKKLEPLPESNKNLGVRFFGKFLKKSADQDVENPKTINKEVKNLLTKANKKLEDSKTKYLDKLKDELDLIPDRNLQTTIERIKSDIDQYKEDEDLNSFKKEILEYSFVKNEEFKNILNQLEGFCEVLSGESKIAINQIAEVKEKQIAEVKEKQIAKENQIAEIYQKYSNDRDVESLFERFSNDPKRYPRFTKSSLSNDEKKLDSQDSTITLLDEQSEYLILASKGAGDLRQPEAEKKDSLVSESSDDGYMSVRSSLSSEGSLEMEPKAKAKAEAEAKAEYASVEEDEKFLLNLLAEARKIRLKNESEEEGSLTSFYIPIHNSEGNPTGEIGIQEVRALLDAVTAEKNRLLRKSNSR